MLSKLLSSEARAEIFRLLFGLTGEELHLREIQRRSGMEVRSIQLELARLSKLDLVIPRRSGNRLYYRANPNHPLFPEIRGLVRKTSGLVDVLRDALAGLDVQLSFVFGSVAAGEEKAGSDIDLFVVGSTTLRKLAPRLKPVEEKTGREVNPIVFDEKEFLKRVGSKEHFVTRILESPRLMVLGTEDDLGRLVQERLVEAPQDER